MSASYGGVKALSGVSLGIGRGEVITAVGANGAGKSTLLRVVMRLVKTTGGSVRLRGSDLSGCRPHDIVAKGIAFVPEGRRLFPMMTVEENLIVGSKRGNGAMELMGRVFSIFPSLEERRAAPAGRLSGGEQQMVAIGRALMAEPELLLVDEPTLGLAPAVCQKVVVALEGLSRGGTSILIAEQNASAVMGISDRTYLFESGRVVKSGPSGELARDPALVEAYLGSKV